jgi:hypothetical protein
LVIAGKRRNLSWIHPHWLDSLHPQHFLHLGTRRAGSNADVDVWTFVPVQAVPLELGGIPMLFAVALACILFWAIALACDPLDPLYRRSGCSHHRR